MNTQELVAVLEADMFCRDIPSLVCGRDKLINHSFDEIPIVISNIDPSRKPGSHWIAIYKTSNSAVEYFDSYGLPPLHTDVNAKLSSTFTNISFNTIQLQGSNTSVCGQYCLVFLLLRVRNYAMNEITDLLSKCDNNELRDHTVNTFINNNFSHVTNKHHISHDFSFLSDQPYYNMGNLECML